MAEEALAIALFCALKAENFAHGVLLAVNHSGDSDSVGAITGNILGRPLRLVPVPVRTTNVGRAILALLTELRWQ